MKRPVLTLLTALMALPLSACPGPDDPDGSNRGPFREDWQVEADAPFNYINSDGDVQISAISIGGRLVNDNFANRGDVIVNFDGPENRILVEMRRFTFAVNRDAADEDYRDMNLWAYSGGGTPSKPDQEDEDDNCLATDESGNFLGWQSGCEVRVYFDGLTQLQRAGADIRVTLPPSYRHDLEIVTEDNDADGDYLNRGNVCVSNLNATADITLQQGQAWVIMAPETTEVPTCAPANVQTCADAGWDAQLCPCEAGGSIPFGQLKVDTIDNASAEIRVDLPSTLWAQLNGENRGEMQTTDMSNPFFCEANITIPGFTPDATGNDQPWQSRGSINYPGGTAVAGAGFNVQAYSDNCAPVAFTEDPDDFVGTDNGAMQTSEKRGNIELCSGCLQGMTCDQLIN